MSPYFETIKVSQRLYDCKEIDDGCISQSFADVPFTHGGIETQSFLEASDGLGLVGIGLCCQLDQIFKFLSTPRSLQLWSLRFRSGRYSK